MSFDKRAWSRANYRKLRAAKKCVCCGKATGGKARCSVCDSRKTKYSPEQVREWCRNYRNRNPGRVKRLRRDRERLPENREKKRLKSLIYRQQHREKFRIRGRLYYCKNRKKLSARSRFYQLRKGSKHLERRRELRLVHKDSENKRQSKWRKENREKVRHYARKNRKLRLQRDFGFVVRERLRTRIRQAIKCHSGVKAKRTMELLGCSLNDFRVYIESKFDTGMTWENWGHGSDKWNLDHIIPCAIFDLTNSDHQKRCFHFSNYQPLWQPDNFKKGARYFNGQIALL